ncbi:hypothetical protein D3C76_614890 [compost metagenome]
MQQQTTLGLGFIEQRLRQNLRRDDPLRQVIEPFEATPGGHCHFTGGEQPFQCMLFRAPVPPGPCPFLASRQAAGTQRTPLLNAGQHPANRVLLLSTEMRQLLIDVFAAACPPHPPAHQRVKRQGQQGCFMTPVFEQGTLSPLAPGGLV